jgi:hypothetical protein
MFVEEAANFFEYGEAVAGTASLLLRGRTAFMKVDTSVEELLFGGIVA